MVIILSCLPRNYDVFFADITATMADVTDEKIATNNVPSFPKERPIVANILLYTQITITGKPRVNKERNTHNSSL